MFNRFSRKFSNFVKTNFNTYAPTSTARRILISTIPTVPAIALFQNQQNNDNEMNTIIFGSGEYVTGYTGEGAAKSDKSMGVVGLVCFDLRQRGLIGSKIAICGTNGDKFDGIRNHWDNTAKKLFYNTFKDPSSFDFTQFPKPGIRDVTAYKQALKEFSKPGDICIVFTPDDTHFEIVEAAIDAGLHVLVTKPFVKTLREHLYLVKKAEEAGVLLQLEVHKRYDPMYNDAVNRIKSAEFGNFNYFQSYMSQPKSQLITFKRWAGISSDISYYLNSHHIDLHVWSQQNKSKCIQINAFATNNVCASKILNRNCEDTITICGLWENISDKSIGHSVYTSSWTAIQADVHSQQRFFCLMENGEINIDQAHRGYTIADNNGFNSINPLFIRNEADNNGNYSSQNCYGYITFQKFVEAAKLINDGIKKTNDFDNKLPTGNVTSMLTAILEAGRISLDNNNKKVFLKYDKNNNLCGLQLDDN